MTALPTRHLSARRFRFRTPQQHDVVEELSAVLGDPGHIHPALAAHVLQHLTRLADDNTPADGDASPSKPASTRLARISALPTRKATLVDDTTTDTPTRHSTRADAPVDVLATSESSWMVTTTSGTLALGHITQDDDTYTAYDAQELRIGTYPDRETALVAITDGQA